MGRAQSIAQSIAHARGMAGGSRSGDLEVRERRAGRGMAGALSCGSSSADPAPWLCSISRLAMHIVLQSFLSTFSRVQVAATSCSAFACFFSSQPSRSFSPLPPSTMRTWHSASMSSSDDRHKNLGGIACGARAAGMQCRLYSPRGPHGGGPPLSQARRPCLSAVTQHAGRRKVASIAHRNYSLFFLYGTVGVR